MGLEIQVDTLEDMCSLMCDNALPRRETNMNNLEIFAINKLKKFCTDVARDGMFVGSNGALPFEEDTRQVDVETTALIVSIIEGYIEDIENE